MVFSFDGGLCQSKLYTFEKMIHSSSAQHQVLVSASFEPTHLSLSPRVTPLKAGLYDWLELFARPFFLRDMSDEEARDIMQEVVDVCRRDCQDESGKWAMMYARLRFSAALKNQGTSET